MSPLLWHFKEAQGTVLIEIKLTLQKNYMIFFPLFSLSSSLPSSLP